MNLPLVVLLTGCDPMPAECLPDATTGASSSGPGDTGDALDCSEAEAVRARAQEGIDEIEALRDNAHFATLDLVEMQAEALRAATEPISELGRTEATLGFEAHLADVTAASTIDPAVDPATLGLTRLSLANSAAAVTAYVAVGRAIDDTELHLVELEVALDDRVDDGNEALAAYPECGLEVSAREVDAIDRETPLDDVRYLNIEEGRALIAEALYANAAAQSELRAIRDDAVACASETMGDDERYAYQVDFVARSAEVDRVAYSTSFNGHPLADGTRVTFAVVLGSTAQEVIDITVGDLRAMMLGVDTGTLDMTTSSTCSAAISGIDAGLELIDGYNMLLRANDATLDAEADRL